MRKHSTSYPIRALVLSLIFFLLAQYLPMIQINQALAAANPEILQQYGNPGGGLSEIRSVGSVETRYGLVVILVDEDVWKGTASNNSGLFSFLGNAKLSEKIETYAEDVQQAMPWTKSMILTVGDDQDAASLQRMLERFYFEGNPEDSDPTKLSGVVVIGDVPLPVVNKEGHRFVSMLPYTDFEDPAYILDGETQDFLPNAQTTSLQAEVWHGVIVPPVGGSTGMDMLAEYFDKNHAFHQGEEEYTTFNEKVFLADMVTEEETINKVAFSSYERFLNLWQETTYSWYSADLLEELYLQMLEDSFSSGDGLDNDGDGQVDEEAANGYDDDGDGYLDEDLGDGLYNIDNDLDGEIDEDGLDDNNNDEDWEHTTLSGGDADFPADQKIDEDPPGDANGDGCAGECNEDDNGYGEDHDGDGYATGWEIMHGYDPYDDRRPWKSVENKVTNPSGGSWTASEAEAYLRDQFTDGFYKDETSVRHPSCYDTDGSYHPEWDDDEDGFCDEDPGPGEELVWNNDGGSRHTGGCLANDADCDGSEDEDPTGEQPAPLFDDMPDIQMKTIVDSLMARYAEMFEKPLGEWNRLVNASGRWDTRDFQVDGSVINQYDTMVSLISKKDEYVYHHLGRINNYFEDLVDEMLQDGLVEEIPMIVALRISGEITVEEEDPVEFCDPDGDPDLEGDSCAQFINFNFQKDDSGTGNDYTTQKDFQWLENNPSSKGKDFHIYGRHMWNIDNVAKCSMYAGSYEDGQIVQYTALYSTAAKDLSKSEIRDRQNCVPENMLTKGEIPQLCDPNTATHEVRDIKGSIVPTKVPGEEDTNLELVSDIGYAACYEFREWSSWEEYRYDSHNFNDWIVKKLRKFRKNGGEDDEDSYEEFIEMVEDKIDSSYDGINSNVLRKQFKSIDILADDEDRSYTVKDIFKDMGWDFTEGERSDDVDIYLALNDGVTIRNPDYGSGTGDVEEIDIDFEKMYIKEGSVNGAETNADLTDSLSEAMTVSSFYKHTQPWANVLNKQIEAGGTPDLPIDETRRVSFVDNSFDPQEIEYLNVFEVQSIDAFEYQVQQLAEDFRDIAGGGSDANEIEGWLEDGESNLEEFNVEQLADALAWQQMSIDEKHEYMFTHYLGEEEPIMGKARDGYELAAIVAEGSATQVQFAFNGMAKSLNEEDPEFLYGGFQQAEDAWSDTEQNQHDAISNVSNTTPVVIFDWFAAVKEWLEEVKESVSSFKTHDGGTFCGDASQFTGPTFSNGTDVPDGAFDSTDIYLSTEQYGVLEPDGARYQVSVSMHKADGTISTEDNYSQIQLSVVSGEESIFIDYDTLTVTGGIATFGLSSGNSGDFLLQAAVVNRDDVAASNVLEGSVVDKVLFVSTHVEEIVVTDDTTVVEGDLIEIYDNEGTIAATVDPVTGELDLRGDASAELKQASSSLPTRVLVSGSGGVYGSIFLIPENKRVTIGDGLSGVFVETLADTAQAKKGDAGVSVFDGNDEIALVTKYGQIAVAEDYNLVFMDPVNINLYEPLVVKNSGGTDLFTVTIKHDFDEGDILGSDDPYGDYLGARLWPAPVIPGFAGEEGLFTRWIPSASAEVVFNDTDGDGLDDLDEWTIGTDMAEVDTDGDGFTDGEEIAGGFDPLVDGAPLFTDMDAGHPAYQDIATLYLRGVLSGFADGTMRPDEAITRENFVKVNLGVVCKACANFSDEYTAELFGIYNEDPFPDDDFTESDLACIAEAKTSEIVDGYGGGEAEGYFLPQNNISWVEAIKVVVNTAELPVEELASTAAWYQQYINTAEEYELLPEDFSTSMYHEPITRGEFATMVVNTIEVNDCRLVDTDGEGLSDAEELYIYGTDPELKDTDRGGVNDYDEVVRGSDPLDGSDDYLTDQQIDETMDEDSIFDLLGYDHEEGLYVVSDQADYEEVTVGSGESEDTVKVFTDEIPADGESVIYVHAEIRDQSNSLYDDDNTSVIEFVLSTEDHGELVSKKVQVDGGIAETSLVSTTDAGEVTVEARIVDGSAAGQDTLVHVYPGEPVRVALSGDSSVLPAGGESVTDMQVTLYDVFGNRANNGFYVVTLETEGGIELLDLADGDPELPGYQVRTPDGFVEFRVLASVEPETAVVKASLMDVTDSGDQYSIEHLEGMTIALDTDDPFYFAGSESPSSVDIRVVDKNGQTVTGFQGDVSLSFSDDNSGRFEEEGVSLSAGEGSAEFSPGTLAGVGSIIASSPGIESGSTSVTIKPADAVELTIRQADGMKSIPADERSDFIIEAFDEYGNLVTTDSSTTGTLRTTDMTTEYGRLSTTSFVLNQGAAEFSVLTTDVSGQLNLVAAAGGLTSGSWGGDVDYFMEAEEFAAVSPQMLYGSMLGGPFGDVTQEDYLGGWMTFNGRTQAMTSLITDPVPSLRLATIDANGSVTLPEGSFVTQSVSPAGSELPLILQWREYPSDANLADVFYVVDGGVSMELLIDDAEYEVEEKDGATLLRADSAAVVKVREDGQVIVTNSAYNLVVNGSANGLSFLVIHGTDQVARIDTNSPWTTDVNVLESDFDLENWDSLSEGLYVRPSATMSNQIENIPTGNSTSNPMGIALVNPDEDLPNKMQPSMGYTSIDAASDKPSIGWEDENKHLLLYAAGNTVGQANLYYASEVGVVLGDPTISLPTEGESNAIGFTSDLGTMVSASTDEVLELINVDYNGDDQEDVLVTYADGRIEVLQNTEAPVRLQNLGPLLMVENGIVSVDKGDFNKDGLDDLIIITETSCFADEMCLYLYENIGGGFVAQNLTIEGIDAKPIQVVSADLNNDDYTDLVIADENMKVYVVWNAEGTLDVVDEIQDFGMETDSSQNLYADVVLRYDGMEDGSAYITMQRSSSPSGSESDAELDDFISSLGLQDFELKVNDAADTGSIFHDVDVAFEYADNEDVEDYFNVIKSMTDTDGGKMEIDDTVRITISLSNETGSDFDEFYFADTLAGNLEMSDGSWQCVTCSEVNALVEPFEGGNARPWVFGPLSLASGESVAVTYEATVTQLPQVRTMVAQDFYDDYTDDDFADIAVTLEGNTTGQLMVYYSDGFVTETVEEGFLGIGGRSFKRVNYREKEYSPDTHPAEYSEDEISTDDVFEDADGDGIPDMGGDYDDDRGFKIPESGVDIFQDLLGAVDSDGDGHYSPEEMNNDDSDADGDGINDTIDPYQNSETMIDGSVSLSIDDGVAALNAELSLFDEEVEAISNAIEDVVSKFTCNGGCLAFLPSMSFLTPGTFTAPLTGLPIGIDFGTPAFGILPYLPVVCAGPMCYGSQVMRMYLSPTTTLGLGLAICVGPYGLGQCFSYSVPLMQALGVCDALNGFVNDAMSKVSEFASVDVNIAFNDSGSQSPTARDVPKGVQNDIFAGYQPPDFVNMNISIPGFPSIVTEWWKNQKFEFMRMLDLPDVTFIYPHPDSLAAEFTGFKDKVAQNNALSAVDLDQSTKFEELTSNVLHLENFLNMMHALPLIDIVPAPVTVKYPWVTPEEIEAIKQDATQWVEDTKNEWNRFRAQFCIGPEALDEDDEKSCLRENLTPIEEDFIEELQSLIDGAITGVEQNLAVIEGYAKIPEQILQIRTMGAYYAQVIICYIDAILSFTAGYILENAQRVEAWIQWVLDMTAIIKGWKLLLQLAIDLMASCDQCTNQRWSGIHLLLSLFIFIPDLPVIEMPKLPDILIDVSNIQAGLDIAWPDINFVPEPINIPELPRIYLPGLYFDLDFDFDLEIPVLPQFDLMIELPELPGLTLPSLPSLPPPPSVPEILPAIEAALSIASNIIKIICVIRQGFIPVPEMALKGKIEDITQRAGGLVLPIDLNITVEWPSFSFDFLERVDIKTYINLTFEFPLLYTAVKNIADKTNDLSGDIADMIEAPLVELRDALQEALDYSDVQFGVDASVEAGASEDGVDAGGEVEVEASSREQASVSDEVLSMADAFSSHPLVQGQLVAFQDAMVNLEQEVNEWSETVPEEVRLVATERTLALDDPLLNRYDEIINENRHLDPEFLAKIEGTPLAELAVLREELIAYTEDMINGTQRLESLEGEQFLAYLAEEQLSSPIMLASDGEESFSNADSWNPEDYATDEDPLEVQLAEETDEDQFATMAQAQNQGIYIYNREEGVAERLVDYVEEAGENVSILFMDVDNDGDDDVVYSMGGDIYFKENYSNSPRITHLSSDPEVAEAEDYAEEHSTVHNLHNTGNSYQESSFAMSGAYEAVGYDVQLYDSLDAADVAPEDNVKRLLLLSDTEETPQQVDETPFASHTAQVVVSNIAGKATLLNGTKRTLIEANGELRVDDVMVLQATQTSRIEISANEGDWTLELSAHDFLELPAQEDRTVRIETGEVIWLEEGEVSEEFRLIEGMAILPEEMIELGSSRASVDLMVKEMSTVELDNEEVFVVDQLFDVSSPASSIELENGAYYTTARALFSDGAWGTSSSIALLNPQICGDNSDPFPVVDESGDDYDGDGRIDIPIYSTTELSGANSFDSGSEIVDAYWDFDSSEDIDGNGVTDDDAEVVGLVADIGPYDSIGIKEATLWITDVAGNQGTANVEINVFVPEITISSATTERIIGTTEIASPEFPFDLVRERSGAVNLLGEDYLTDENGDFSVTEFDNTGLISVYNQEGSTVAQFNPETKQAIAMVDGYTIAALPADESWPSRLVVYEDRTGHILGSFIVRADDTRFVNQLIAPLENFDLSIQSGVSVYIAGDEDDYTVDSAGLSVTNEYGSVELSVTPDGNIQIFDERFELRRRDADSLADYLILEIYDQGALEVEIWLGTEEEVTITDALDLDLPDSESITSYGSIEAELGFEDISESDPLYEDILEMVEKEVLSGYLQDGDRYFKPEQEITRAEFTKIILSILCILPSDEAYLAPNVFNDILDSTEWFYSWTKESYLRGLIHGYLGELDADGLTPFKPFNEITRAEATKIVLEALEMQGITQLDDDIINYDAGIWYEPYIDKALKMGLLTSTEAEDPNHILTRYEFVEMAVRVLEVHNCFEADPDSPEASTLDLDPGIYAVRESCYSCPCEANIDYDAELRAGDTVFAIIRNSDGEIYGISNKVTITE